MNASLAINNAMGLRLFLSILALLYYPAWQADATEIEQRPAVLDINVERIENLGLFKTPREGRLSLKLWDNSERQAISALMPHIHSLSPSPALQKLTYGFLLSESPVRNLRGDFDREAGDDLFTARIEALVRIGAYRQAFALYTQVKSEPYHERLARAGVLAMLNTGEKSLACVEAKTVQDRFLETESADFWKDLSAYCTLSLTEEKDEDLLGVLKASQRQILSQLIADENFTFSFDVESFAKLSPLERGILAAENKLDVSRYKPVQLVRTPAQYIEPLRLQNSLTVFQTLRLTILALDYSLIDTEELRALYVADVKPVSGDEGAEPDLPAKRWQRMAYYFHVASNAAKGQEQWEQIRQALPLAKRYSLAALMPFAPLLGQASPDNATLEEIETSMRIFHKTGTGLPQAWANRLLEISSETTAKRKSYKLLSAALFMNSSTAVQNKLREQITALGAELEEQNVFSEKNIIAILDKTGQKDNNAAAIYEKDFHLTTSEGYVMPTMALWDALLDARDRRAMAEAILLSLVVFPEIRPDDMYPALFRDFLSTFSTVGLKNVSRKLAVEAILGI